MDTSGSLNMAHLKYLKLLPLLDFTVPGILRRVVVFVDYLPLNFLFVLGRSNVRIIRVSATIC